MFSDRVTAVAAFLSLAFVAPAGAQAADPPVADPPYSMGQPRRTRIAAGIQGGYSYKVNKPVTRLFANFTPEGLLPNLGIDLMSLEVGATYREDGWGGDLGYFIRIPFVRTGVAYDYDRDKFSYVFTLQFSARRGGLFRHGEEARFDYWTGSQQVMAGLAFNATFWKYRRTRPIHKTAKVPDGDIPDPIDEFYDNGLPPDIEQSVREIEHAVEWLDRLLTPNFIHDDIEKRAKAYREHIRTEGHNFDGEDERYHTQLRRAFGLAIGDDTIGDQLGTEAEHIIFEELVVPYDSLFGFGKRPKEPDGYAERAIKAFDRYLQGHSRFAVLESGVAERQKQLAYEVFRRTVAAIHETAENNGERWKTARAFWSQESRLSWLPLNYGLRPEQYDTQSEWDAITERLTGHEFTEQNTVEYLLNERFQYELLRMILDTRDYHVLIVHDFQGRHKDGSTDEMGWMIVADGYMRAMIEAIKALDTGERERLPQFMIFIDQNYYQANGSRPIITYLEELYSGHKIALQDTSIEKHVADTRQELLDAIHESPTFKDMGKKQLEEIFKVHINVTNPWDPSFAIDIDKRDHRKFAFRDVFEEDPASGEGVLTGTGVGEHYLPPSWEDRAFIIRGPALVELKRAAKRLCFSQGFKEKEIPFYLRDRPFPPDYNAKLQALWDKGWHSNIMIVNNDTGYGEKKTTAQRAVMYNLAPRKSVLLSIDSLWLSDFWAEMYISAALRGARVYAIAPSPENAPSSANLTMFLMQETLELLVGAREYFQEDLDKAGGRIHVGLYDHGFGTDDPVARAQAFIDGVAKTPFVQEDFPMNTRVLEVYREFAEVWREHLDETGETLESEETEPVNPYLHMKTQFFGTEVGMQILRDEGWQNIVHNMAVIRSKQFLGEPTEGITPLAVVEFDSTTLNVPMMDRFEEYLASERRDDRDHVIFAFTIGSMNQDRRGMLSDGEILAVVSGYSALIGVVDMYGLATTANWVVSLDELRVLFPKPNMNTRMKNISRYLQDFF